MCATPSIPLPSGTSELATPDVENRLHILERLLDLYEETGKDREAVGVCEEIE